MISLGVLPDFGTLPPEINSARMYAGPGAGPMLAAASAWDGLAVQLSLTASGCRTAVSELGSSGWMGSSSISMASAVAPHLAWMRTGAAQAEQAAGQARAAAAAYEAAFAMTVPPPIIAANRATLRMLVATNLLGQNTAAIAATEAQYAEMWAQDAAAMYGYAASSSTASALAPFTSPEQNTGESGLTAQSAAVAHATGAAEGTHAQSVLTSGPQLMSALHQGLGSMTSPLSSVTNSTASGMSGSSSMSSGMSMMPAQQLSMLAMNGTMPPMIAMMNAMTGSMIGRMGVMGAMLDQGAMGAMGTMGGAGAMLGESTAPVMASTMGSAASVGALSVPNGWISAAPEIQLAVGSLPMGELAAAPQIAATGTGSLFGEMALAGLAGRAMAGTGMAGRPSTGPSLSRPRAHTDEQDGIKSTVVVIRSHAPVEVRPVAADAEE